MSEINIKDLYDKINGIIKKISFEDLWHGFKAVKFALYNDNACYFDGKYIEKTAEFTANTAILYKGEYIAIWYVQDEMNLNVFVSKIIHEMFHAYQNQNKWGSFTNEMEALYKYRYSAENISIKYNENQLLIELSENFDKNKYQQLLEMRKYRQNNYPYEFHYEACAEDIEGSANYVEWQVLKQLDIKLADKLYEAMKNSLSNPQKYMPIRINTYYSGALFINAVINAGIDICNIKNITFAEAVIEKVSYKNDLCKTNEQMNTAISKYIKETEEIINGAVTDNDVVINEQLKLKGVNIYDARCLNGYITSRYFVMYEKNGNDNILSGNFVIKMLNESTIEKVYRWN